MFDKMSEYRSGPIPKRPMSAYTGVSRGSRMSALPEIGKIKLVSIASDILRCKGAIVDYVS